MSLPPKEVSLKTKPSFLSIKVLIDHSFANNTTGFLFLAAKVIKIYNPCSVVNALQNDFKKYFWVISYN